MISSVQLVQKVRLSEAKITDKVFDFAADLRHKKFSDKDITSKLKSEFKLKNDEVDIILSLI